ncbi:MAG: hypothetical protein ACFE85_06380, partial [Candidatus Hodarchaeota archaeon]
LIITSFLLITIGGVVAYPSSIETFAGGSHGGCHAGGGSTPPILSVGSTVTATSVEGVSLSAGQQFTVNVVIDNFTEALSIDRNSMVSVAVPRTRGDNAVFGALLEDPIREHDVTLDVNGDSNVSISFTLVAPFTNGDYDLVVDVLAAVNHTDGSALPIIYATDTLSITISGGLIPGFEIYTLIGVLVITTASIIVIVRRRRLKASK